MNMRFALIIALGLIVCGSSFAGAVGPNCYNCYGGIYTLDNLGLTSSTASTQTYKFAYKIDTAGFVGPNSGVNYYIGSLALKVTSQLVNATLISSPSATGTWILSQNANINNAGCNGSGSGWVCIKNGDAPAPNGIYTWQFSITMATGSLLDVASIQANYDPPNGVIMSQTVSMPEGVPTEFPIAITAAGFWLIWCKARKHRSA